MSPPPARCPKCLNVLGAGGRCRYAESGNWKCDREVHEAGHPHDDCESCSRKIWQTLEAGDIVRTDGQLFTVIAVSEVNGIVMARAQADGTEHAIPRGELELVASRMHAMTKLADIPTDELIRMEATTGYGSWAEAFAERAQLIAHIVDLRKQLEARPTTEGMDERVRAAHVAGYTEGIQVATRGSRTSVLNELQDWIERRRQG